MTPAQCRMARAALKWTTMELADYAGVSQVTLNRYEGGQKKCRRMNIAKLRKTFEDTGEITFLNDDTVIFSGADDVLRETD